LIIVLVPKYGPDFLLSAPAFCLPAKSRFIVIFSLFALCKHNGLFHPFGRGLRFARHSWIYSIFRLEPVQFN